MYMVAVVAPGSLREKAQSKLRRHFAELEGTGLAGAPQFHSFGDVLLAFDGSSPFAEFSRNDESFTLTGGYRLSTEGGEPFGSFATIALDASPDGPELSTDADTYYPWPLYYAENRGIAAVGNDVHAVAIAVGLTELDERAIFELVTRNYVIGRYTTVAGVSRVIPGEQLRIPASAALLSGSLKPEPTGRRHGWDPASEADFDLDTVADTTFDSLVRAVPLFEVGREDTVVQLSGGLDSRLTSIAIRRAQVSDVHCVTLNLDDGEELKIAETITERFGFSHEKLELPEGGAQDVRDAWLLNSGQCPLHAAAGNLTPYRTQLEGKDHIRVVGSWPADLLVGDYVPELDEFTRGRTLRLALKWWIAEAITDRAAVAAFGRSKLVDAHVRRIRRMVAKQMTEYEAPTAAQRLCHWAFDHCAPSFTFISPARLCSRVLEVSPVMTPEVIENFFRLRGVDLPGRPFYQRMIWQQAPELRDQRYHNTGKLLTPDYPPLPAMSWKLKLLLRLPLSVYSALNRRIRARLDRRGDGTAAPPAFSVQTRHWDRMFAPHIQDGLKLTESLTAHPERIENMAVRVQITATMLACAWTRDYLAGFAAADR